MSLLTDRSPLSKLHRKRLFDHDGCQECSFPPNFKHAKFDAICQFPKHCGALAPRVAARPSEGVSGGAAAGNLKTGEEGGPTVPVKPSGNSVPSDMKSLITKPLVSNTNVEALAQGMTVDVGGKVSPKSLDPKLTCIPGNLTAAKIVCSFDIFKFLSQPCPFVLKYPPPKIRKGVTVYRTFPMCFGTVNPTSNAKVLVNKSGVEHRQLVETRTEREEIRFQIQDGHDFVRKHEGNALKEMMDKLQANSMHIIGTERSKHTEDRMPSEQDVKQDKERVDVTEASQHNHTMEKSLNLSVKAAIRCEDSLFDNKERHEHILLAKGSNDFGIVPYDNNHAVVSRNKVREALNLFEDMFTKLSKECEAQPKLKGKANRQIYVEAAMHLKTHKKWVNTEKLLGPVPGVEVGDWFRFRAELVVIGLHHEFQGGIDYKKKDGRIFATSLVASGRYANDAESSDVLIYSGQGGNPTIADKKPQDQKLERGNLALKNSMDAGTPVRVIRGCQTMNAFNILGKSSEKILKYIYDGLYIVTNYCQERGSYGKLVFKFELHRLAAQPKLTWGIVGMPKESKVCKVPSVTNDISQGKEKMPIRAVNIMDGEKPSQFDYNSIMVYPKWYNPSNPIGCDCINGCSDSKKCLCTIKNGGKIPFNNNGAIIMQKPIVYECGPSCKCPSSCNNRVSQHGIRYQLEVFKTESRGWGVRSRNYISSGSFICEYVGELLRDKEAEAKNGNDEYLFDIGSVNDDNFLRGEDLNKDGFAIDAAYCGNVGRFINHSCSPNLYAQNVLYDHDDKRMSHIVLFATKNIPPLRELTYDYKYKVDQVHDCNGNVKKKNCYCGSRECSGRMY